MDPGVVSTRPRILRNVRLVSAAQGYGALLNLLLPMIVVVLGVEQVAVYQVGVVLFGIFRVCSDWGVGPLSIRDVARDPALLQKYQRVQIVLRFLTAGACLALLLILGRVMYGPRHAVVVAWFGVALFLETITEGYRWAFRATQHMGRDAAVNAIERTSVLALTTAAVMGFGTVEACAAAFAAGQLVALVAARLAARCVIPARTTWDSEVARHLIRLGPSFVSIQALWVLYSRIDYLILDAWPGVSDVDVGLYALAYLPYKGLQMVPEVTMTVLYPVFAELHARAPGRLRDTVRRSLAYVAGGALAAAALVFGARELIVDVLLLLHHHEDEDTSALGPILAVLIIAAPLYVVTSIAGHLLAATGRQLRLSAWYLVALALNVGLNVSFAIPRYGAMGCAAATVATEAFLSIALIRQLPDGLDHLLLPRALSIFTASAALVVASVLLFGS